MRLVLIAGMNSTPAKRTILPDSDRDIFVGDYREMHIAR
ncbi:hypothetical protein At1D1460_34280 [Agrobacterium tumefaciens]|jgi:hypothetical protein|nr:hypothetical protein At1D1460_34280 [Agrobacterium tumefaciens]SPZ46816.1 Uncharacterised protein [Agrobacterium tumefaciens]